MIVIVQGLVYSIKDVVDNAPIQVMMIGIPMAIILLAGISTATAKLIEVFVTKK